MCWPPVTGCSSVPPEPNSPTIRITGPGPFTTVQDHGRHGRGHQGVARSGAFDQRAYQLANRLAGNVESAPVLEVLLGPIEFVALSSLVFAAAGTNAPIDIVTSNGGTRTGAINAAVAVRIGDRVTIGVPTVGLRTYVSFRGGLEFEPILGSCSYDSLGLIGPPPLSANQEIRIATSVESAPQFESVPVRGVADNNGIAVVALRLGPRHDWLLDDATGVLSSAVWSIDGASNRTGIRLAGTPLARRPGDLPSEAMITGAVQLPPSGLPIVLGPDGGTTGGYPVIGVVSRAGLDILAQRRPGEQVQFSVLRS
jgi:biotin-dependent carboxylase-like uncharacterized protein